MTEDLKDVCKNNGTDCNQRDPVARNTQWQSKSQLPWAPRAQQCDFWDDTSDLFLAPFLTVVHCIRATKNKNVMVSLYMTYTRVFRKSEAVLWPFFLAIQNVQELW